MSRRTVFYHFPTKEAMLFDHLAGRREMAIQRLRGRPVSEPPLVSLHAVLRELCQQGYDRRLLAQIRGVLEAEPHLAGSSLSLGIGMFEKSTMATLESRLGQEHSSVAIRAVTFMALGWFISAVHVYVVEGRPSLVECFDEAVASCLRWNASDL